MPVTIKTDKALPDFGRFFDFSLMRDDIFETFPPLQSEDIILVGIVGANCVYTYSYTHRHTIYIHQHDVYLWW